MTVLVYQLCSLWAPAVSGAHNPYGLLLCFNFSLALITVIHGPAKRVLLQIGAKKGAAEKRACFPV